MRCRRFRCAGRRVLLVDDSRTQCEFLQQQLRAWGIEARYAVSAIAALELLTARGRRRDARSKRGIIDLKMPGLGGMELARMIRASTALRDLPLVLISSMEAGAAAEDRAKGWGTS